MRAVLIPASAPSRTAACSRTSKSHMLINLQGWLSRRAASANQSSQQVVKHHVRCALVSNPAELQVSSKNSRKSDYSKRATAYKLHADGLSPLHGVVTPLHDTAHAAEPCCTLHMTTTAGHHCALVHFASKCTCTCSACVCMHGGWRIYVQ